MLTINNIRVFIGKNTTPCRVFWGLMYTLYFIVGWMSFYSTKMCSDYMSLVERGNKSKITMHALLGLGVYGLLVILVVPLVYILHQTIKEIVENAKRVMGTDVVVGIYRFLASITFPILSACMSSFLRDTPSSLWTFIGIVGSMYCLIIGYVNPRDYGLLDGFFALGMGILLNMSNNIGKYVVVATLGVSSVISKEIVVHHKKVDGKKGDKKTHGSNFSRSVKDFESCCEA